MYNVSVFDILSYWYCPEDKKQSFQMEQNWSLYLNKQKSYDKFLMPYRAAAVLGKTASKSEMDVKERAV